jgi:phosphoglycerate dehydrogenase-like enzyme
MKPKVLLDPHFRPLEPLFPPEQIARMRTFADVIWARDEPMPPEELDKIKPDLEAIITGHWRHGSVDEYPKLKAILEVGGSFPRPDLVDYTACFRRGIRILSCAPGFAPAVAEMALVMAIAAGRGLVWQHEAFRTGGEKWGHKGSVDDFLLFDKPVGFIGFGNLARVLKSLLAPFRCQIKAYDPWLTDAYLRAQGVTPAPVEELLSESKVVFVLAVPSQANKALLDRAHLEMIRPDAVLVLISRSHLVDFDALTEMALAGRLTAAIDVFPEEPLPLDHPIRKAPNVILSAHRAGGGSETYRYIGEMVTNDLEAVCTGRPPQQMQQAQAEYIVARGEVSTK